MKWMKGVVLVVGMLALSVVGCGGGGDGGNGTDTPPASSAATMNMMATVSSAMFANAVSIMGTFTGGAMVAKDLEAFKATEEVPRIECTWAASQFTCVVWDSQGSATSADHKCDITGTWPDPNLLVLELRYDCVNFNPDPSVTVDGSYDVAFTINPDALSNLASVKTCLGKQADSTKAIAECTIQEGVTEFQSGDATCSWDSDATPLCATAGALFSALITVRPEGLTVVDPCGTYVYGAATTMTMAACMPSETILNLTFTMNGTFNGAAADATYNVSCEGII